MNPIFIIGSERSGSNLLRLILNSHSNIDIPHPPHILKNFAEIEPWYGDLNQDQNFVRLVKDVIRSVELHPYPWKIKLHWEDICKSVRERNLVCIFFSIYDQHLKASGKKRWGCKSTFVINHVESVRKYYPAAKFIYLVRDGRDVALSARKTIFNHYSTYYVARLWKAEQQKGIHWLKTLSQNNILLLKYENLITSPEKEVRSVCSFLDEPFEERMLKYHKTKEAALSGYLSDAWKNTAQPILGNNKDKYLNSLNKKNTLLFESIAGEELSFLSYDLTGPSDVSASERAKGSAWKLSYFLEEIALKTVTQTKYLFTDKNNALRYKKYLFLKYLRLRRWITT